MKKRVTAKPGPTAEPVELMLLRRFAALPRASDRLQFMVACLRVFSGESVDNAFQASRGGRRSLTTLDREAAKAETRKVARVAAVGPAG